MAETTARRSRFWLGLLIYVLVFAILAGAALLLLYQYMEAYEQSRPASAIARYRLSLEENGPTQAMLDALSPLDPSIRSREENIAFLEQLLAEASFPRLSRDSSPEQVVYGIRSGDRDLGRITLTDSGSRRFGLSSWEVAEEAFDLSAFFHSSSFTVPADYSCFVNGVELDESFLVDRAVPYETLADFYDRFDGLPTLVRYECGPYLGELETRVQDPQGKILTEDELNESFFLDRCDDHIRELAEEFIPRFLGLYVDFSSNLYGSYYYNFMQLRPLVLTDSQLHKRMSQAIGSFGYTTTKAVEIQSIELHFICPLSEDRYLADLSYATQITGSGAPVVIEDNIRLVLYEHKDYLMAEALYNY